MTSSAVYLTETNDYLRFLDRLIIGIYFSFDASTQTQRIRRKYWLQVNNLRVPLGYSENKEFVLYCIVLYCIVLYCIVPDEREDGRICHHVVTHVFNKPEGKLELSFVSCFCVYNVNTAFGQKYE